MTVHARIDLLQDEFLISLYENYHAQSYFLRRISLPAVQTHAVQALVVLGLAYAAALLAQGVSVYRLCGNGVFPVPVAAHFLVAARLVRHEVPV